MQLVSAFEAYARGKAADFLLELDNWLAAQVEAEGVVTDASDWVDTGVNVFLYIDPPATEPSLASRAGQSQKPSGSAHDPRSG